MDNRIEREVAAISDSEIIDEIDNWLASLQMQARAFPAGPDDKAFITWVHDDVGTRCRRLLERLRSMTEPKP